MYSPDGKLLRKLTSDTMAAHFPETIRWSPDSTTLAFVAILRVFQTPATTPATTPENATQPVTDVNANTAEPANTETQQTVAPSPATAPTPAAPTGILAFRTEQIYICNADGGGVKPLTQDDGLKYFYYAWSPDSTMLVARCDSDRMESFCQYRGRKGRADDPVGTLANTREESTRTPPRRYADRGFPGLVARFVKSCYCVRSSSFRVGQAPS